MSIKLKGFDDFEKKMKQLQRNAERLNGTHEVSYDDLFTPSFMNRYTDFSSFGELLEGGGFVVNSVKDFEDIPDDVFDQHISKTTQFESWKDMHTQAVNEYVGRQLGL
ncbi:hypothetical protein [Paenibacillus dakarensis]|uniref:hypothetical protein n=1 Tax=Paenibacillus dakarensis TaxID=1527293 RepID=UPI0006D56B21|nr:hypothetical protein [Paenibacillus dakarensis]